MAMIAYAARALGLATLISLALPGSTSAAQAPNAPLPLELEVRVSTGGPDEAALHQAVEKRVRDRLAELGHAIGPDEPVDLDVSVAWYDEAETTYVLSVVLRNDGELVNHATETCPRCGTTELFERLTARIDRAEEHLAAMAAKAAAAAPVPLPANEAVPAGPSRRSRLTGLGWAGVAVAGTGLVVSAVGAGVWSKGRVIDPDSRVRLYIEGTDYRPPGIALVATGGALLLGGVTMLVVDVTRARHRRVRVSGAFDRSAVVAVVTGRF